MLGQIWRPLSRLKANPATGDQSSENKESVPPDAGCRCGLCGALLMNEHLVRFPSGRTVAQAKKDAKALQASSATPLAHTEALNQIARKNGLAMSWAEAMATLSSATQAHEPALITAQDLYDRIRPPRFSIESRNTVHTIMKLKSGYLKLPSMATWRIHPGLANLTEKKGG